MIIHLNSYGSGQGSVVPAAVENRDYLSDQQHFPRARKIIITSLESIRKKMGVVNKTVSELDKEKGEKMLTEAEQYANMDALAWWRLEGVLLVLKEVGCAQKRIHQFVLEDNVLPLLRDSLKIGDVNIVRACLFVLRQFA